MPPRDTPIQRKLVLIILLTSAIAMLLMRSAFLVYEYLTFRQATLQQGSALARVIAANSTAVLTFGDQRDAEETLSAFEAEGSLVAAALYDADGNLFSYYPTNLPPAALPETPQADGFRFGGSYLTGFEPVVEKGVRKGTLYLKFDTGPVLREWLRVSGLIGGGVIGVVLLVAYLISRRLQQQISQPILALADTAKAISARRDYSVRARRLGGGELGLLTDAFNQMLEEIQKQTQALRESEGRVRAVLDSGFSAVIVIDSAGRITDLNSRAERMFGWTRAEALGLPLAETIIPPRFRDAHSRGLEHYLATGEGPVLNRSVELSALRRDATEFPVELSISPMKAGDVVSFCGFITDISERKRQEEMRARFVAIVQSSDDAILSKTLDGFITSWNPGAEKLFGYTSEEVLGKPVRMLIPPEKVDEEVGILERVARGEAVHHCDTVRRRKDGTLVDTALTISAIRDSLGKIVGASTIARDITERRRAEERFRQVVECSPGAIVLVDQEGKIALVNAQTERLFGYDRTELDGKNIELLVPERFRARHPGYRGGFFASPSTRAMGSGRDLFGLSKDGREVPVEIGLNPIEIEGSQFVLASIIDITERKRAEERFRRVVESSPNAIVLVNQEGKITMVNAQTEKLFGYARAELVGQTIELLVPERFRAPHPGYRGGFFANPSARAMGAGRDLFGLRKDGREVPVEIGLNPMETEEGQFVLASIIDITERKAAEQQVLLQATALETAANAIMITDHAGTILWTNPAFSALTGYEAEDIIGRNSRILKSGQHDQAYYEDLWVTLLQGQTWRGGFINRRKDGSLYQDEHTITPVRSQDGTITHFIAIMQDVTERNQAQRVLRRSEAQLRLVWENSLDAMRLVDEAGVVRRVNSAYCHMIGKPQEAIEGQPMSVLYESSRSEEVLRQHRERFRAHRIPAHHETEVTLWNGRRMTLELSNSFLDVEGQAPLLFSTIRDVTERKQAEEELRRQHHLLRTLIDQLPDYIYVKDSEGRFVVANLAVAQIMGADSPEALLGKTDADFYPREESAKYQADEARVLRGEALINKDEPHLDRHGQHWEMLTTKVPLRDSAGKITGLVGIGRDVTKSKQAEKREMAFAKLGQNLSAVATLDAAARLIADAADELFGCDACTLDLYVEERDLVQPVINIDTIGGKRTDVPPTHIGQPPTPTMRRVLEQGAQLQLRPDPEVAPPEMGTFGDTGRRSASLMHVPIRRGQKVIGILSIQSYSPRAYDEKELGFLQTLADQCAGAMERVRAEEDLRRLNEELEQRVRDRTAQLEAANKEMEAFSYSVSHDLRAPLRHIDGFSEMLRKEAASALSAPGQRFLGIIAHSAKRMGDLIDDLLVFSRMGRAALRPVRVKMDELVAEVLREMANDLAGRTIQWDIGPLAEVNVDRSLFKQVWVNLLSNAVKYTRQRAEARIQVRCRENDQGEFEFSVQDNGAGFDMTFAGKLFGVFQRLHQAEEFEGTGIGLANVRRIVARHGGRTWGEGKVDTGATFYFTVPHTEGNKHEPTRANSAG